MPHFTPRDPLLAVEPSQPQPVPPPMTPPPPIDEPEPDRLPGDAPVPNPDENDRPAKTMAPGHGDWKPAGLYSL